MPPSVGAPGSLQSPLPQRKWNLPIWSPTTKTLHLRGMCRVCIAPRPIQHLSYSVESRTGNSTPAVAEPIFTKLYHNPSALIFYTLAYVGRYPRCLPNLGCHLRNLWTGNEVALFMGLYHSLCVLHLIVFTGTKSHLPIFLCILSNDLNILLTININ